MDSTNQMTKRLMKDMKQNKKNAIDPLQPNMLLIGGTLTELNDFIKLGYTPDSISIITLNIDKNEQPTIVGNIEDNGIIPDKTFDIIYFSAVPANDINMEKAITNAGKALKDHGIIFFKGQATVLAQNIFINSCLTDNKKEINITKMMRNQGLCTIKKLRFLGNSFSQSEVVATKNPSLDLNIHAQSFPVIKQILLDCTGINYPDLNTSMQTVPEELIEVLTNHINSKTGNTDPTEIHKVKALSAGILFLQEKINLTEFEKQLSENPHYNAGIFSYTEKLINQVIALCAPDFSLNNNLEESEICRMQ